MAKFRMATCIALLFVLLCTVYWLQQKQSFDQGYTAAWVATDAQMLHGDSGGSKIRYIASHSAGQYDQHAKLHAGQEYMGRTRKEYGTNPHGSAPDNEGTSLLQLPVQDLVDWLNNRRNQYSGQEEPVRAAARKHRK